MTTLLKVAATSAAIALASPAFAACQRTPVAYDMPAQRLDEAVQQLSRRSGCAVAVDPAIIADRRAPGLKGRYTPEQALARLIRNTGYTAQGTRDGLSFDNEVLATAMSQARVLRTTVNNQARAGRITPAVATRQRATLTQVERTLPRQVNTQGMVTLAQRRDVVRKLEQVRAATGPVDDAQGWAAFKRAAD